MTLVLTSFCWLFELLNVSALLFVLSLLLSLAITEDNEETGGSIQLPITELEVTEWLDLDESKLPFEHEMEGEGKELLSKDIHEEEDIDEDDADNVVAEGEINAWVLKFCEDINTLLLLLSLEEESEAKDWDDKTTVCWGVLGNKVNGKDNDVSFKVSTVLKSILDVFSVVTEDEFNVVELLDKVLISWLVNVDICVHDDEEDEVDDNDDGDDDDDNDVVVVVINADDAVEKIDVNGSVAHNEKIFDLLETVGRKTKFPESEKFLWLGLANTTVKPALVVDEIGKELNAPFIVLTGKEVLKYVGLIIFGLDVGRRIKSCVPKGNCAVVEYLISPGIVLKLFGNVAELWKVDKFELDSIEVDRVDGIKLTRCCVGSCTTGILETFPLRFVTIPGVGRRKTDPLFSEATVLLTEVKFGRHGVEFCRTTLLFLTFRSMDIPGLTVGREFIICNGRRTQPELVDKLATCGCDASTHALPLRDKTIGADDCNSAGEITPGVTGWETTNVDCVLTGWGAIWKLGVGIIKGVWVTEPPSLELIDVKPST